MGFVLSDMRIANALEEFYHFILVGLLKLIEPVYEGFF